jgi:retron-type reverse transcriptase
MENNKIQSLLDLPKINSVEELSELMHISDKTIISIYYNSWCFYRRFSILKKSGKNRQIFEPNKEVKAIQAWILKHIIYKLNPSMYATAYRKNYSILDNVRFHQKQRYFLCLDIENYFPSINTKDVEYFFYNIGYSPTISELLAELCTCNNSLPQGGITSPALANMVSYNLDKRIAGFANKKHIIYTRYADDITLSSNNRNLLNYSYQIIQKIIIDEGFKVNEEKTRILGPSTQCKITGLIKNSSLPVFSIGKKKKNHMRSVIFNLLINNRKIDKQYETRESIIGWMNFTKYIDVTSYNYIKRYYQKCDKLN